MPRLSLPDLSELIDKQLDPDAVHQPSLLAAEPVTTNIPPDVRDSGTDAVPSGHEDGKDE
jgi:hypothetical protein